ALEPEPSRFSEQAGAVSGNVYALRAGVSDDAFQPVPVRHQPFPSRPAELRRRQRERIPQRRALEPDTYPEILQDLPVRPPAAVRVIGDHFFAARLEDADPRVPVDAVGRDLELQDRIALAGVQPVLEGKHLRPAAAQRLVKIAAAPGEFVHYGVHAG